jgi:hypothetical protein
MVTWRSWLNRITLGVMFVALSPGVNSSGFFDMTSQYAIGCVGQFYGLRMNLNVFENP